MRKLKVWFRANFKDYPYWRVRYKDGRITRLLYHREAYGLAKVFKGKIKIDYSVNL